MTVYRSLHICDKVGRTDSAATERSCSLSRRISSPINRYRNVHHREWFQDYGREGAEARGRSFTLVRRTYCVRASDLPPWEVASQPPGTPCDSQPPMKRDQRLRLPSNTLSIHNPVPHHHCLPYVTGSAKRMMRFSRHATDQHRVPNRD